MAFLTETYDNVAIQQYIDQKFLGVQVIIGGELEKAKQDVEYCKREGKKISDVVAEMANKILDGAQRATQSVADANETRRVVQGTADSLDAKHTDIDGRIQLGEQEAQTSLGKLKDAFAKLIGELNAKFAEMNQEATERDELLDKNLLAWSVTFRQKLED